MPSHPAHSPVFRVFRAPRRTGAAVALVIGALVLVAVLAAVWYFFLRSDPRAVNQPLLQNVSRGPYEFLILEQGEVESSNNVEIRCEVRARSGGNTATSILDVVREGTFVEPGDLLVRLDSSALEEERVRQKIVVNTSEGVVVQAKSEYETAVISKEEYLETVKQEEQEIQNEIIVAEEKMRRSQETAKFSERLAARGYLTPLQLEGDQFAVEQARNELELARRKIDVLRNFTRRKMLIQFEAEIETAQKRWENEQNSHQLEVEKLADIEDQLAKCELRAPQAGQVVYANVISSRGNSEFIVEEGATVRERQVLIRLPDPQYMQVKAKINESRITLVKPGMPVEVRIDAMGDRLLAGEVVKVNKYAEPTSWWSSQVKQYGTDIKIFDPPEQIRPGLTAEVRIVVERRPDALQVPVPAVYEHKGHTFCLVKNGDRWETRRITIRSTNEKTVAIDEEQSELQVNDQVVMNPRAHADKLELPELPDPEVQIARTRRAPEAHSNTSASQPVAAGQGGQAGQGQPETAGGRAGSYAELMQRLDKDNDGRLSSAELQDLPAAFRDRLLAADRNHDGYIDRQELQAVLAEGRPADGPAIANGPALEQAGGGQ